MNLNDRLLATVLAALRYWQQRIEEDEPAPLQDYFDEHNPLSADEIDALCEQLNASRSTHSATPRTGAHTPGPWRVHSEQRNHRIVATVAGAHIVLCDVVDAANARLIAEAPTLYALAQDLLAYKRELFDDPDAQINGADLVDWFTEHRNDVHSADRRIEGKAVRS